MKITSNKLILLTAIFIVAGNNVKFFSDLARVFPFSLANSGFLTSTAVVFVSFWLCYSRFLLPGSP